MANEEDVTLFLKRIEDGDRSAIDDLLPHVYGDLRSIADRAFRDQPRDHTLQPTVLVHEAYLRLVGGARGLNDRAHFLSVAAIAMRQLLTDHARRKRTDKRGGDGNRVALTGILPATGMQEVEFDELDAALEKLQQLYPRHARIVELRFFGGMTHEEIAEVLDVSVRTIGLDWKMARAWLRDELGTRSPEGEDRA